MQVLAAQYSVAVALVDWDDPNHRSLGQPIPDQGEAVAYLRRQKQHPAGWHCQQYDTIWGATAGFIQQCRSASRLSPYGRRTAYVYDAQNRKQAVLNPIGYRTTTVYNSVGEIAAMVDALGNRTTFSYAYGQQVSVMNPLGYITTTLRD